MSDRLVVRSTDSEATENLASMVVNDDNLVLEARDSGDSDLPIGSDGSDDFDVEPADDIFYDDGVDFEKCQVAGQEIVQVMLKHGLRYREAVAVLHKIHRQVDTEGGNVLDA